MHVVQFMVTRQKLETRLDLESALIIEEVGNRPKGIE